MVKSVFKVVPGIRIRRGLKMSIPLDTAIRVISVIYGEVEAERVSTRAEAQSILEQAYQRKECPIIFNVM